MTRHRRSLSGFVVLGLLEAVASAGPGGEPASGRAPTAVVSPSPPAALAPEAVILRALASNPVTSAYRFTLTRRGGSYALAGKVGTKVVHDAAIRTLIGLGFPVRDDLTIDTAEAYRAAARTAPGSPGPYPSWNGYGTTAGPPFVYPPPLFGRLDDPFFGFEPPLVSYPPWWRSVAAREPIDLAALNSAPPGEAASGPLALPTDSPGEGVEMTLDTRGVAVLRGRVPTQADRQAVAQKVARTPGIAQVVNLIEVGRAAARRDDPDTPPPPPTPAFRNGPGGVAPVNPRAGAATQEAPAPEAGAIAVDGDPIARRVADALRRRPALAALPIKVNGRDGVATLSGRVPSVLDAVLAFRAAQQTPGVREVVDRIEFPIPDVDQPNPLRDRGRPEDVEPYLLAQIRRQVGDLAHVDQVLVRGDALEVRGTLARSEDTPRVEATLRSIPLLRGFRLDPQFRAE